MWILWLLALQNPGVADCGDVAAALVPVDVARYAGQLQQAIADTERLLECPALDVDDQVTLHLRLAWWGC